MKLSLSVRVAESFSDKKKATLTIDELITLAKNNGYEALCMRASQAGTHSSTETIREKSEKIQASGLTVSMVTADFAVPMNDHHGPGSLSNISPSLDIATAFGANLIRICMKSEDDIARARRASDEAAERGIRLAHQSHFGSLFETTAGALRVIEAVDRSNFGIIYEPANWWCVGQNYGPETIKRLGTHIFNAYTQNHRFNPESDVHLDTWTQGRVGLDHIGIWEQGGVDSEAMFEGLHTIGYDGFVTVHQSFAGVMSIEESVRKSAEFLKLLMAKR